MTDDIQSIAEGIYYLKKEVDELKHMLRDQRKVLDDLTGEVGNITTMLKRISNDVRK